jgi:hypothetical protein
MREVMSDQNIKENEEFRTKDRSELVTKMTLAGWGLFFIWIGVALLIDIGIGIGLLGVGIITLIMQVIRKFIDLSLEWFWIVVGLLFVVSGVWELIETELPLVPILLIVVGVLLFFAIIWGKYLTKK